MKKLYLDLSSLITSLILCSDQDLIKEVYVTLILYLYFTDQYTLYAILRYIEAYTSILHTIHINYGTRRRRLRHFHRATRFRSS